MSVGVPPPLDAHAHLDTAIASSDISSLGAFVFAMTRSLAEFEGLSRRDSRAIWALGVHPGLVRAQRGFSEGAFRRLLAGTPVIGEVGLDGASRVPKELQISNFRSILQVTADAPRIISIHSYQAQTQVLRELNRIPVRGAVLHWWTGTPGLTEEAIRLGCYFSVPPSAAGMLGVEFLRRLPRDRILTETDHPSGDRRGPLPRQPGNVREVERNLMRAWSTDLDNVRNQIWRNLVGLVDDTETLNLFGKEWHGSFAAVRN